MTRTWTCLIPLAMLATHCIADDALNVQVPAGLAKDARMLDVVKEQCSLPEVVGEDIFSAVSQVYSNSKKVDSEASVIGEAFLKITILSAQEWAGGGWSGSKEITIQVDLIEDDRALDTTTLGRSSRGGLMGPAKGTCAIFHDDAENLGKQAAKWVKKRCDMISAAKSDSASFFKMLPRR